MIASLSQVNTLITIRHCWNTEIRSGPTTLQTGSIIHCSNYRHLAENFRTNFWATFSVAIRLVFSSIFICPAAAAAQPGHQPDKKPQRNINLIHLCKNTVKSASDKGIPNWFVRELTTHCTRNLDVNFKQVQSSIDTHSRIKVLQFQLSLYWLGHRQAVFLNASC